MIDISSEHLVPLRYVPGLLPRRPNGKAIHASAVYRWVMRGIGGVRLETVKIGGTTYTSVEALQRFAQQRSVNGAAMPESARSRDVRAQRANDAVQQLLYPKHRSNTDSSRCDRVPV